MRLVRQDLKGANKVCGQRGGGGVIENQRGWQLRAKHGAQQRAQLNRANRVQASLHQRLGNSTHQVPH